MNNSNDNSIGDVAMEPGKSLSQARIEAGISIEEVAKRLHLSPRQVKALDTNNYNELPESTYVKGYLRNYATLLGLKAEPLLAAYAKHYAATRAVDMTSGFTRPQQMSSNDSIVKIASFGVAAVIISLTAIWWYSTPTHEDTLTDGSSTGLDTEANSLSGMSTMQDDVFGSQFEQDVPDEQISEAFGSFASPPEPLMQEDAGDASTSLQPIGVGQVVKPRISEPLPQPAERQLAPQQFRAPGSTSETGSASNNSVQITNANRAQIVLYVNEDSWADIRDARDNKLLYETVPAGRVVNLEGVPPFSVFLGNADGVKLRFNNKDYDVSRHKRGLVARFKLYSADAR